MNVELKEKPKLIDTEITSETTYTTKTYTWKDKTIYVTEIEATDDNIGTYNLETEIDEDNSDELTEEEKEEFMELIK